jgi:type I restriction enzyme M protein
MGRGDGRAVPEDDTVSADSASTLVRKLWRFCNVLRDDGLSYPDYVEQLTYLLFLKMADERHDTALPAAHAWKTFAGLDTAQMHLRYGEVLTELGALDGTLGLIFRDARNKIADPAKLRLLVVELVGRTAWSELSADVKGDAYEGLLEKNARDTKSGAGQYFTPRPLIDAIVQCVAPAPKEVILDPACGTGGFLLAAHEHILQTNPRMRTVTREHLRTKAIRGVELVQEVARLAAMNLFLHDVSAQAGDDAPVACFDSLAVPPSAHVDVVLTNPPFGVKGSVTYTSAERRQGAAEDLTVVRPDFWVRTANKQLNFVQHVVSCLRAGGRAAVVLPDNVLYEAGGAEVVRRHLLQDCDVHTLLRLPTGLFYAAGVQANVLFLDRRRSRPGSGMFVYDLRSGNRFSLKKRPLRTDDLREFVALYHERDERSATQHTRWRWFSHEDLRAGEGSRMDLTWDPREQAGEPPSVARLDELAGLIAADLERALSHVSRSGRGEQ